MMSNLLEIQLVRFGNTDDPDFAFFCDTPGGPEAVKLLVDAPN
jgi:hypothetical protein